MIPWTSNIHGLFDTGLTSDKTKSINPALNEKPAVQWKIAAINSDKPVNAAWMTNKTGATNMKANSIGSVTPTKKAEIELAKNQA